MKKPRGLERIVAISISDPQLGTSLTCLRMSGNGVSTKSVYCPRTRVRSTRYSKTQVPAPDELYSVIYK